MRKILKAGSPEAKAAHASGAVEYAPGDIPTEAEIQAAIAKEYPKEQERAADKPPGYVTTVAPDSEEAKLADMNTAENQQQIGARLKEGALNSIASTTAHGSLGLADKIAGVLSMMKGEGYRKGQQSAEKSLDIAKEAAPEGALLGAVPYMGVGSAPTALQRLAAAGGVGLLRGGASSKAQLDQDPGRVAKDALKDAATSVAVQGGFEVAGKGLGVLSGYLKNSAESQAARAMGMEGGISNKARKMGLRSEDDINALARTAMDEGLIPFGGSKKAVQDRARALVDQSTNARDAMLNQATMSGIPFDPSRVAAQARGALTNLNPAQVRNLGPASKAVEDIEALGQGVNPGDYSAANSLKSSHQGQVNWGDVPNPNEAKELLKRVAQAERAGLEEQVGDALRQDPSVLGNVNRKIGQGLKVEEIAKEAATRAAQRRTISPFDLLVGSTVGGPMAGSGHVGTGVATGAGLALLSSFLKNRGSAVAAPILDKVAAPAAQAVSGALPAVGTGAASISDEDKKRLMRYLGLMGD